MENRAEPTWELLAAGANRVIGGVGVGGAAPGRPPLDPVKRGYPLQGSVKRRCYCTTAYILFDDNKWPFED
jgi:hypothetical protein